MSDNHSEKILKAFWLAMIDIYGRRWIDEYGEEPGAMWRGAITDLPTEKIKIALEQCRDAGDAHPITLSVFMKRVRGIRLQRPEQKALPPKPVTEEHRQDFQQAARSVTRNKFAGKIRSILLKGESYSDFLRNSSAEIAKGKTMFQVKWERLNKNGWTMEDEEKMASAARVCHYPLYQGVTNLLVDHHEKEATPNG